MSLVDFFSGITIEEMTMIRRCVAIAYTSQIHGRHSQELTIGECANLIKLHDKIKKES